MAKTFEGLIITNSLRLMEPHYDRLTADIKYQKIAQARQCPNYFSVKYTIVPLQNYYNTNDK